MNYSSALGSSDHQMVSLLMSTKPLNVIVGQPTTKTMNRMMEQMAQIVLPVKTTTWGGLHDSLALVLDDKEYALIIKKCDHCQIRCWLRGRCRTHCIEWICCQRACPGHGHWPNGPPTRGTLSPVQEVWSHHETEQQTLHSHDQERRQWQRLRRRWAQTFPNGPLSQQQLKIVTHKPEDCYSLRANKSKIPAWYKPHRTNSRGLGSENSVDIDDWIKQIVCPSPYAIIGPCSLAMSTS